MFSSCTDPDSSHAEKIQKFLAELFDSEVDPFIAPHAVPKLDIKIIKIFLLQSTVDDLNAWNNKGFTYLQVAIAYTKRLPEFFDIVEIMLHKGTNPNLQTLEAKDDTAPEHIQKNRKFTANFTALDFVASIHTHIKGMDARLIALLRLYGAKYNVRHKNDSFAAAAGSERKPSPVGVGHLRARPAGVSPSRARAAVGGVSPAGVSSARARPAAGGVSPSRVSPARVSPSRESPSRLSPFGASPSVASPSPANPSTVRSPRDHDARALALGDAFPATLPRRYSMDLNSPAHQDVDLGSPAHPEKKDALPINSALHAAIKNTNLEAFEQALSSGANLEEKNEQGETPLLAIAARFATFNKYLVDGAFSASAVNNLYAMMMKLLTSGANWSAVNNNEENIFHIFCENISVFCKIFHRLSVQKQLDDERKNISINTRKRSRLDKSATEDNNSSQDPDSTENNRVSADHKSPVDSKNGVEIPKDIFQFFLEQKFAEADAKQQKMKLKLSLEAIKPEEGFYLLQYHSKNTPLQLLLRNYPDLEKSKSYEEYEFYLKFFNNCLQLYQHVKADLHPRHSSYVSPLMLAARRGDFDIVDALIDAGVDISESRGEKLPPAAAYADLSGQYEMANYLKHKIMESQIKAHTAAIHMGINPQLDEHSPLLQVKQNCHVGFFSTGLVKIVFEMSQRDLICKIFKMSLTVSRGGTGTPNYFDKGWQESLSIGELLSKMDEVRRSKLFDPIRFVLLLKCYLTLLAKDFKKEMSDVFFTRYMQKLQELTRNNEHKELNLCQQKIKALSVALKKLRDDCTVDAYLIDKESKDSTELYNKLYQEITKILSTAVIPQHLVFQKNAEGEALKHAYGRLQEVFNYFIAALKDMQLYLQDILGSHAKLGNQSVDQNDQVAVHKL